MKLVLLLAVGLVAMGVVAAPTAAAGCPDPDHPCTPQPIDPFQCPGPVKVTSDPVGWAMCRL